jgi:hypothetical protein
MTEELRIIFEAFSKRSFELNYSQMYNMNDDYHTNKSITAYDSEFSQDLEELITELGNGLRRIQEAVESPVKESSACLLHIVNDLIFTKKIFEQVLEKLVKLKENLNAKTSFNQENHKFLEFVHRYSSNEKRLTFFQQVKHFIQNVHTLCGQLLIEKPSDVDTVVLNLELFSQPELVLLRCLHDRNLFGEPIMNDCFVLQHYDSKESNTDSILLQNVVAVNIEPQNGSFRQTGNKCEIKLDLVKVTHINAKSDNRHHFKQMAFLNSRRVDCICEFLVKQSANQMQLDIKETSSETQTDKSQVSEIPYTTYFYVQNNFQEFLDKFREQF